MWKEIIDFPNYKINEHGPVLSLHSNKILQPRYDKDGYCEVGLYNVNGHFHKRIHRLVLEAFVRPGNKCEEVHHINEIRDDNNLSNLRWVTRQENDSYVKHKVNNGSYPEKPVYQINPVTNDIIASFKSRSEASRQTGCQISKISLVCSGKRKTTGGYKWICQ